MPRRAAIALLFAPFLVVACAPGPTASPSIAFTSPTQQPIGTAASALAPAGATPTSSLVVTPNPVGFAFAAEDVLAYYASVGYECTEASPSAHATGYMVQTCVRLDPAGRVLTIGLVTDPGGTLGNAFASVEAVEGESFLEPVDALDPLSGFLGAMLGSDRAAGKLEWLASHAGDVYAEISEGGLRIATYTAAEDDHTTIFVELANQAYLNAPAPSDG